MNFDEIVSPESEKGRTSMNQINQLDLFEAVKQSYAEREGPMSQPELYEAVAGKLNIDPSTCYGPVGKQNTRTNLFKRKVRWVQQSMKQGQLLQKLERGMWELTGDAKTQLQTIKEAKSVIAMSTSLGIMICSKTEDVFNKGIIGENIDLVLTSPPYLLQNPRSYGGPTEEREWVEFVMSVINKITPRLSEGASIALNIGTDSFVRGQPARNTHIERLTLAMIDADFYLVDRLIWRSNKSPQPYAWTSLHRFMLRSTYEYVLHFTNDPKKLMSNNQRVLLPHSQKHIEYVQKGGNRRDAIYADGADIKRVGDYSQTDLTKGKLRTNDLYFSNKCIKNELVNKFAREQGLPMHSAKMPFALAEMLITYLCPVGGLVLDPFGGTATTGSAAEKTGRRWISIDPVIDYIKQSFIRFSTLKDDVWFNPDFIA